MSTDSTELTFVRCPSCRSLVPAVSTRCRMCGAGIDAQGKESSSSESAPPRRTRQNTINQPPTEFVQAVDAVKAAESAAVQPEQFDQQEEFDPLSEYLDPPSQEEVPVKVAEPVAMSDSPQSAPVPSPFVPVEEAVASTEIEEDDFDIFADDDDWLDDLDDSSPVVKEDSREVSPSAPEKIEVVQQEKVATHDPESQSRVENQRQDPPPVKAAPMTREQPRVVVESGARPAGKPSAFSFSKGKADENAKRNSQEQNRPAARNESAGGSSFARQQPKPKDSRPPDRDMARNDRPRHEPRANPAPVQAGKRDEVTARNSQHGQAEKQTRDRHEHRPESVPAQRNQQAREQRPKAPAYEGVESRLVGWLVSFSTPTRSSYELREGKFFISGSSLKPNDLVLNDPSIATPHAIVAVESGRLQVQDLMSDSGVFRRRAREAEFLAYGEPFELKHGDWVRFGNIDFLVTMIPSDNE